MPHTTATNFSMDYVGDVHFTESRRCYVPQFGNTSRRCCVPQFGDCCCVPQFGDTSRCCCVPQFGDKISSHLLTIFFSIVTFLISLVQIKYQGKVVSPFEFQPKTMRATIIILLIYCLSYFFMLRNPRPCAFVYLVIRKTVVFSGALTIAFLLSLLFPVPNIEPVLLSLSIFVSLIQLFGPQIKAILDRLEKAASDSRLIKWLINDQSPNRGTRRGLVTAQLSAVPPRPDVNRVHRLPL